MNKPRITVLERIPVAEAKRVLSSSESSGTIPIGVRSPRKPRWPLLCFAGFVLGIIAIFGYWVGSYLLPKAATGEPGDSWSSLVLQVLATADVMLLAWGAYGFFWYKTIGTGILTLVDGQVRREFSDWWNFHVSGMVRGLPFSVPVVISECPTKEGEYGTPPVVIEVLATMHVSHAEAAIRDDVSDTFGKIMEDIAAAVQKVSTSETIEVAISSRGISHVATMAEALNEKMGKTPFELDKIELVSVRGPEHVHRAEADKQATRQAEEKARQEAENHRKQVQSALASRLEKLTQPEKLVVLLEDLGAEDTRETIGDEEAARLTKLATVKLGQVARHAINQADTVEEVDAQLEASEDLASLLPATTVSEIRSVGAHRRTTLEAHAARELALHGREGAAAARRGAATLVELLSGDDNDEVRAIAEKLRRDPHLVQAAVLAADADFKRRLVEAYERVTDGGGGADTALPPELPATRVPRVLSSIPEQIDLLALGDEVSGADDVKARQRQRNSRATTSAHG